MDLRLFWVVFFTAITFLFTGCGQGLVAGDFASSGPATSEPEYKATPTVIANPIAVQMKAKFLYRALVFSPSTPTLNGLRDVVASGSALPIPFAEFHIYDSAGNRIQQGETDTTGTAKFNLPKTAGTFTLKVFSRAYNQFLRASVLEDTYANQPYSISKDFTISAADITAGTKDLTSTPVFAQADEHLSTKIEGAAFNILFDILLANEYIRDQIGKNILDGNGVPSTVAGQWWVADKVTAYWKAGFNPRSYFSTDGANLSFYGMGTNKLYILGGANGDVKNADTDQFDDSVILHEYAHFLEDNYGNSVSPGGSHNGNFIIDPRLAWSEGWANYFQAAVLNGNDQIPSDIRLRYYVDTIGYKSSAADANGKIGIAFDLTANPRSATYDRIDQDPEDTGLFRELSISRTLYKSSRAGDQLYDTAKYGGGIIFKDIWTTFSGENNSGKDRSNPVSTSLRNTGTYPISNMGLFNYLLNINTTVASKTKWNAILADETQKVTTVDYAHYLSTGGSCTFKFDNPAPEVNFADVPRSNPQMSNNFYLYYHNGSQSESIALTYSNTGTQTLDLDLIVYKKDYVYFEDYYIGKYSTSSIANQSRRIASLDGGVETVSMANQPSGWYIIDIKINAYNKSAAALNGKATYTLKMNGVELCGSER
ncbi:hypothetical protein [Bdellovibrio svalbardensis]|uniref:Uncharacterized protein n=1 Tax=Bdellovibrio svalbardensis TaxID=2972972 RepID=A0ABT6DD39_9BACT|nr:hypothetical protein [Bdellovibrio svalbardensis]MDG0814770.1 hypothetical protein [Bdellovibrio svalbardensis]